MAKKDAARNGLRLLKRPRPVQRREPLPGNSPKSTEEDPEAHARIEAILSNPSYRRADTDFGFLAREDLRGLRLQLDYLKPDLLLQEAGVRQTIVVFGSTRICEHAAASREVETLTEAIAANRGNHELEHRLAAAKRILAKSHYYDVAREFGRLVSEANNNGQEQLAVIMTGGGPGVMEAANRGAFDAGAKSVGLNITLPHEQFPNPYITPGLCFNFHYFAMRKFHFVLRAKALVAFPGGYGTFDELFEVLTLVQTQKLKQIPVVLVGKDYWRQAVNFDFLADEGVIAREDRELFWYAETAEEIWNGILAWYAANGAA